MSENMEVTETSISIVKSETADCELEIVMKVSEEKALRGAIPLSYSEAKDFIDALGKELKEVASKTETRADL